MSGPVTRNGNDKILLFSSSMFSNLRNGLVRHAGRARAVAIL